MHVEASAYMAQELSLLQWRSIQLPESFFVAINQIAKERDNLPAKNQFFLKSQTFGLDDSGSEDFSFDNELAAHEVRLEAFCIDPLSVNWQKYLEFAQETHRTLPRCVRQQEGQWQILLLGEWKALDLNQPAVHLSWHDASVLSMGWVWVAHRSRVGMRGHE